jgi:ABC-type antimicrobial peptide transport system permease subunit
MFYSRMKEVTITNMQKIFQQPAEEHAYDILLPTPAEAICYAIVSALTLILQNVQVLKDYLAVPGQLHFGSSILDALNQWLNKLVGENIANTVSLSLFWVVVGIGIYFLIEGIIVIFNELGEDMRERTYIWPKGADKNTDLRLFARRSVFRVTIGIILIIYLSNVVGFFLSDSKSGDFAQWLHDNPYLGLAVLFFGECLALHGITVLLRFLLLKRRVFN